MPWVRHDEHGIHAVAGPDAVYLVTEAPLRGERMHTVSDFTVTAGERVPFVLTWSPSHLARPRTVDPEAVLVSTEEFWNSWSASARSPGLTATRSSAR